MPLALHSCDPALDGAEPDFTAPKLPPGIVWLDLCNGTQEEIRYVEQVAGIEVPTLEELSEIETSSRLRTENGTLYLSMPLLHQADSGQPLTAPVGFVLTPTVLVTVRFNHLRVFENFTQEVKKPDRAHPSSTGAFVGLLEAVIDRMADILEKIGNELDNVSHDIFSNGDATGKANRRRADEGLKTTLRKIGRLGDLLSKARDTLLGLGRIVPYAAARGIDWMPPEAQLRLKPLPADITSLNDYDAYLSSKVQFLLDASLGLINIQQNDIIKLLTIVTIVGIGPTLVASWYGMNFKSIPELEWSFGYPYAIVLALVTGIAPLLWLKWRNWL